MSEITETFTLPLSDWRVIKDALIAQRAACQQRSDTETSPRRKQANEQIARYCSEILEKLEN